MGNSRVNRSNKKICAGKKAFDSEREAEAAAFRPKRMLAAWGFMKAYRCARCKLYHYGHPAGFR
jgi:hypothetical protein